MPSGYVYEWTGTLSSAFDTPGNWYNVTAGTTATTSPGTSDEALVFAAGTIDGPGAVFDLGLTGTATGLTIGGSLNGSYVFVGGTVTLASGAGLSSGNLIDIGDDSSETIAGKIPTLLTVGAGAVLTASQTIADTYDIIVGQGGGTGTLAVTGAGALAQAGSSAIWAGNGGTGLITVAGGGEITAGLGASPEPQAGLVLGAGGGTGALVLTGAGSQVYVGDITEVGFGGTGSLVVSAGATFTSGDEQNSLSVGDLEGSAVGNGSVSFSAATGNLYGLIEDGAYGQGSISLSNGATVTVVTTATSGPAVSWSMLIGAAAGSAGTLNVSGLSLLNLQRGLGVGSAANGSVAITGATLLINEAAGSGVISLDAGLSAGVSGVVTLNGGAIRDTGGAGMIIGGFGSGTLAISGGGTVSTVDASAAAFGIADAAGATGLVSITGAGSALVVAGAVSDGAGGAGSIVLSAGAQFTAGYAANAVGLALGSAGGAGSVALGSGSHASVLGQIEVGAAGSGALSVTGGSSLAAQATSNPALVVGGNSGSSGSVTISDTATAVSLAGGLVVGSSGTGTLTVENSAALAVTASTGQVSPGLVIGAGAGSAGTVEFLSSASVFIADSVVVGSQGAGVLGVSTGATLTVSVAPAPGQSALEAGIAAGVSGSIAINGGLVNDSALAGVIIGAAGNGTLSIAESGSQGGTLLTGNPGGTTGLALAVDSGSTGSVSLSGAASLLKVDGTVSDGGAGLGAITIGAGAQFDAGFAATATGLVLGGAGGSGSLALTGGATASILGQIDVGQAGNGSLSVSGGSTLSAQTTGFDALVVASGAGTSGTVLISDAGTYVRLTGGLEAGVFGNANVTIEGGASLAAGTWAGNGSAAVLIGASGGTSSLTVTGVGTSLNATGEVQVGGTLTTGAGALTISAGATASVVLASGQTIAGATIGGAAGAPVSVATVTGSGSSWTIAGALAIGGGGGAGLLDVAARGKVSAGSVQVDAIGNASHGSIVVTGAGSVPSAGTLTLGGAGSPGALTVASGGSVNVAGNTAVAGTASLIGGTLSIAAGSAVSGQGILSAGSIVDLGRVGVTTGKLNIYGGITGTGTLSIAKGGTLLLERSEAAGVGVVFTSGGGTLSAATASAVAGTITGWQAGDFIDLTKFDATSETFAKGTLSLFGANDKLLGTLHFAGALGAHNFTLTHPSATATEISFHS